MSQPDLIIHDEKDNVGVVVIETTKKGQDCSAWIMENDKTVKVPSTSDVPLGHKIAILCPKGTSLVDGTLTVLSFSIIQALQS